MNILNRKVLLKDSEEMNDDQVIYSFLPQMFAENKTISKLAIDKVQAFINTIPMQFFNRIDEKIRKFKLPIYNNQAYDVWHKLNPSIVDDYLGVTAECLTVLKYYVVILMDIFDIKPFMR